MNIYDKENIRLPDEVIESNIEYYRNIEDNNQQKGLFTSWNWASFFFTSYWLLYRRCYKYAVLTWLATGIISFILSLICILCEVPNLSQPLTLLTYVLYGLFGNSIYLNGIKEKIFNLQLKGLSDIEIINKTKPSFTIPIAVFVITSILSFIILVLISVLIIIGLSQYTYSM